MLDRGQPRSPKTSVSVELKCHHRVEGGLLSCCKLQQRLCTQHTAQVTEAGDWLPSTTLIFPVVTCPAPLDNKPHLLPLQYSVREMSGALCYSPILWLLLSYKGPDQIKCYSCPLSLEEEKHQDYLYPSKQLWQFPAVPWPRAGSVHCPMVVGAFSVGCSSGKKSMWRQTIREASCYIYLASFPFLSISRSSKDLREIL